MTLKHNSLTAKILAAIAYTIQFDFPLTEEEIWLRLLNIDHKGNPDIKGQQDLFTKEKIAKILQNLVDHNVLCREGDYFFPTNIHVDLGVLRRARWSSAQDVRQQIPELIQLIKKNKLIRAVAVTGSVAMNNAREKDDLDLLIVTQPGSLWLVRAWLLWQRWIKHKRNGKNNWCLNVWLEKNCLTLKRYKQDFYMAYEVVQAEWIYDLDQVAEQWLAANNWAQDYLPHYDFSCSIEKNCNKEKKICLSFFNSIAYFIQSLYLKLKTKIPAHNIDLGQAFLHHDDSSSMFKARFFQIWQELLY